MSKLNQFNEDIEKSQKLPFCWVVNPPNMQKAQIEKLAPPYGIFIPTEQANAATLNAPEWLEPTSISFGDEGNEKSGFLMKRLRCVVIARSPLYVQAIAPQGGWAFAGIAYEKGAVTELGTKAMSDDQSYRLRSQHLIMLIDDDNQLIQDTPLKLTLGKGPGAAISQEIKEFRKEIESSFFKSQGIPEQRLSDRAHALCILDMTLGFHKSEGHAPYVTPVHRFAPAVEQVGKSKEVSRMSRTLTLEGRNIEEMLISKTEPVGAKIIEIYDEYKTYFDRMKQSKAPETTTDEGKDGEVLYDEDMPF